MSAKYRKYQSIWSYFWFVFSCIWTEYGPEITPYLDTFHAVKVFDEHNDYPIWVINKIFKEFQSKQNETTPTFTNNK